MAGRRQTKCCRDSIVSCFRGADRERAADEMHRLRRRAPRMSQRLFRAVRLGSCENFMLRFIDEPLTVIVLTNLDNPSGRHGMLLTRSIAGIVRPALRPPHDLAASTDPNPALTATVTTLLSDVAAHRASTTMSDMYRIWCESAPGSRAWMAS